MTRSRRPAQFPEKTILAMEVYSAGTKEPKSELTGGFYGDKLTGFSAAIKDKERFPEGWGYVSFMRDGSNLAGQGGALPQVAVLRLPRETRRRRTTSSRSSTRS